MRKGRKSLKVLQKIVNEVVIYVYNVVPIQFCTSYIHHCGFRLFNSKKDRERFINLVQMQLYNLYF